MGDSHLLREAAKVRTEKPLSAMQATILARAYFSMRSGGCGGIGSPVDRGTFWSYPSKEGAGGRPGAEIKVVKATGRTSSNGFLTVPRPRDFAQYILPKSR